MEFKVGQNANSGVGIRASPGERVDGRPRNLEVQIHDDEGLPAGQGEPTGSLFWSNGGPLMRPSHDAAAQTPRPVEIHGGRGARTGAVRAAVNGENVLGTDVQPFILDPLALAGVYRDRGRVGLQRHTGEVRFRNVRIKELTSQPQSWCSTRAAIRARSGERSSRRTAVSWSRFRSTRHPRLGRRHRPAVRVLRPPTGSGKIGEYFAVALSPDGKTLAAGG